jgi:hypothetical protein
MEAVFRPEIFPMIFGRFLPESRGSWQESTGKNLDNFRPEYCFHVPPISGVFLQETMTFPHLSCRIRWPESSTWDKVTCLICEKRKIFSLFESLFK